MNRARGTHPMERDHGIFLSALAFCFVVLTVPILSAQTHALPEPAAPQFFPVNEVRPGMKAVGRTIFQGNKIEEFQVELVGVLKNVLAPKHDVILARLSGSNLAETGVVAGMSGSPVYVNGKLLGAVAIAFPFAKEPYTLITPIQDMLDVVPQNEPKGGPKQASNLPWRTAGVSGVPASDRWIPPSDADPETLAKMLEARTGTDSLTRLRLPLRFGGFDRSVVAAFSPIFRDLGFEPLGDGVVAGAGSVGTAENPGAPPDPVPGSMVSLVLVEGDLNISADCTVTYREGNHLYACGHQAFALGPASVPLASTQVLATIPSLASSFKLDALGPTIGSIDEDRFGAIYGVIGEKAPTIPVEVQVVSSLNRTTTYDFQVADQPLLSPLLVDAGVVSALTSTERVVGPSTLELKGSIDLSTGDTVELEDVISSEIASANGVGAAVATPLGYLLESHFPGVSVKDVKLHVVARNESRLAELEQVWSTKSEVHPGDHIVVTAVELTPDGRRLIQKIPVVIPANIDGTALTLVVGSGPALNMVQMRFGEAGRMPSDLHQLVRELNRTRRNNRLYALLMSPHRSFKLGGDEFPSPPPSLLQTFLADPAVSSSITFSGDSVIGDYQTQPTPYTIHGDKTLFLKVANTAP
ncbi:MAG: SpoIVB peptidase S55 domain-containing protein [Candidatus Dormibacteraceae bacterium]